MTYDHLAQIDPRDDGQLIVVARGTGRLRIGTVSLMPADNVDGMRADTLALLKQLDSPVYRWPGGNFVSGYDWRDGIGERDLTPYGILQMLDLLRPIYQQTAAYGHFGREDIDVSWEKTDKAKALAGSVAA